MHKRTRSIRLLCGTALVAAIVAVLQWKSAPVGAEDPGTVSSRRSAKSSKKPVAPYRSPQHLILAPDESWLVTVNRASDTSTLIGLPEGKVLDEITVGDGPVDLALAPDGRTILVTASRAGTVTILEVRGERLHEAGTVPVDSEPWGIAISPNGREAYVAQSRADRVAVLDISGRKVVDHIEVGRLPQHLAISPDGTRLAVATPADRGITVVDLVARKMSFIERFGSLNIGRLLIHDDGDHVYFPWMIYGNNPISKSNIRRGWVLASRFARVRLDKKTRREAISLDPRGEAVADPYGVDITGDGRRVVLSSAGTHELLVYRLPDLPFEDYGGPGDHIASELLADKDRFFRIETGGRPLGLVIARDDRTVYVANHLDDSVQVVDLEQRKLVRTIPLGEPIVPTAERRGEAIFHDARRSLDQWYSCHTCHQDGGSNVEPIDTKNDGSGFTFKTVLPLYDLEHTPPYTWHGWQKDLDAAIEKSLVDTMQGQAPTERDVADVRAFLNTLDHPRNPYRNADGSLSEAALRGQAIFEGDIAGCTACHSGPHFTDGAIHDVGLEERQDPYRGFNTPSLIAVYRKHRLLHDGRARTLEEVLTGDHAPENVTGNGKLSENALHDLLAYLRSL